MALTEGTENNRNENPDKLSQLEELVRTLQKQVLDNQKNNGNQPQAQQGNVGGLSTEQFQVFMDAVTNVKKKDLDFEEGVDESQIPIEDFVEDGVQFFVPATGYVMSCDRRKGKIVKLPWGKKTIFFEHEGTRKRGQGKFQELSTISKYTSNSAKEIEWIRNHSMYGVLIYENTNNAMNADMLKIQKLSRVISTLRSVEHIDLLKMCKSYNVPQSNDANVMRYQIAHEMVNRELEAEGLRTSTMLQISAKESLLSEAKNK